VTGRLRSPPYPAATPPAPRPSRHFTPGAPGTVKMSQRPGRNAAHCPGWPLQGQRRAVDPGGASPAGLTARARPEARPETRAANLHRKDPTAYQEDWIRMGDGHTGRSYNPRMVAKRTRRSYLRRPESRIRTSSHVFNTAVSTLIILFVIIPLYILSLVIAVRSGLFNFSKGYLKAGESNAIWGFIASGITATVAAIGLLVTSNQNRRSENRLILDTAVRGIALTQTSDGAYGTNAVVAGALATLVHLDHPVIAMRVLAAAWDDDAVDIGSAVWLINEVLVKGTAASQEEAANLFYVHAPELCGDTTGEFTTPNSLFQSWLPDLPFPARQALVLGLVKLLISKDKSWWTGGHRWETPIFREIIETDSDWTIRKFAYDVLDILLSDVEDWERNFNYGGKFVTYAQMRETLRAMKDAMESVEGYTALQALLLIDKLKRWVTD